MSAGHSITNADDDRLIGLVREAKRRVCLVSPGVSPAVAEELIGAWKRLGTRAVNVVIDVDPEVCRLGYGSLDAVTRLREFAAGAGTLVCHQPGIRIGLLICDDNMLVFSPTPLLVEAGSHQENRPNAILLGAVPEQVATDVGLGSNPDKERVVGLDAVTPAQVESVAADLASAPPVKFDLARQVRVFTSRFQFVELEMTGCYVSRKKVQIPSSLVGLAKNDDVASQFHAHFNLINKATLEVKVKDDRKITEESLQKKRQAIIQDFLISLTGYGSVVQRANKQRLQDAVDLLKADVKSFQEGSKAQLQLLMDSNAKALTDALLPAVRRSPPESYRKFHGPEIPEPQLVQYLTQDIKSAFGRADALVSEMKVSLVFKDLAYESLVDEGFLAVARKAMPGVESLHSEFGAAKEAQP